MIKIVFTFIFFQFCFFADGQQIAKQSLLEDLNFLNEALVNGHPVNYNPQFITNLNDVIYEVNALEKDSLSRFDYSIWIEKALFRIGCIHTSIAKNPLYSSQKPITYIPLTLKINNDDLIVKSSADSMIVGQKIISINNIPAKDFISKYKFYKSSDGGSDAFSKEYFHYASSKLVSQLLEYPDSFIVLTSGGEYNFKALTKIYTESVIAQNDKTVLMNNNNKLYYSDNIPILKVSKFNKSDIHFFKESFRLIQMENIKSLVLDLRHSTGGNRKAAIELTRYLVDTTFQYSILQPKLKTRKYLNGKGKLFLFLSKLKYNLGKFYLGHRTSLGKSFTFSYKPKIKDNYKGTVYIITDGFTASSSTMVTAWLKQYNSNALFSGSQSGGGYNGNNGGSFPVITLPASEIEIRFPAYRLIVDDSSNKADGLIPDLITSSEATENRGNEDVILNQILSIIKGNK